MRAILESGMINRLPVLFVDANVLVEAVFFPDSAAAIISDLVVNGTFSIWQHVQWLLKTLTSNAQEITSSGELETIVTKSYRVPSSCRC